MFSVVIPLYNKEISITNTIQSVLNQTFQDFEIIVINDGSTDDSVAKVNEFLDSRIRIVNKTNGGVSSARNVGIKEAKFQWIAFLDGDDIWGEKHLEEIVFMQDRYPDNHVYTTSFVYSNASSAVHQNNNVIKRFIVKDYFKTSLERSIIWTSIVVVNKFCFDKVGGFNEELKYGEDLDMWTRLARCYNVVKSELITCIYRIDAENRSNKSFILTKSRVYFIDFSTIDDKSDFKYHQIQVINVLRGALKNFKMNDFVKLYFRHRRFVRIYDILKG